MEEEKDKASLLKKFFFAEEENAELEALGQKIADVVVNLGSIDIVLGEVDR